MELLVDPQSVLYELGNPMPAPAFSDFPEPPLDNSAKGRRSPTQTGLELNVAEVHCDLLAPGSTMPHSLTGYLTTLSNAFMLHCLSSPLLGRGLIMSFYIHLRVPCVSKKLLSYVYGCFLSAISVQVP